ncbi:MAG: hypothetical protein HUU32_17405 [Calditrichaceae bacterium]|nr:hypothetical protein [Calditrichia bacterium]NUQ43169.1 hypothetical protein [Calditrichaceae bacterium]
MNAKKIHYSARSTFQHHAPYYRRDFLRFFRRRGAEAALLRPGALSAEQVKRQIQAVGVGKVVELYRIGYDGELDDMPVIVEITRISPEGFSGKIINVERKIIEETSRTMVYARRGGGIIDFLYDDGDVKEIRLNQDAEELSEARDLSGLQEVLAALEPKDRILVAYYDQKHRGTVNVEGTLLAKSFANTRFKMVIEKINGIELEKKNEKLFDIEQDLVVDIAIC